MIPKIGINQFQIQLYRPVNILLEYCILENFQTLISHEWKECNRTRYFALNNYLSYTHFHDPSTTGVRFWTDYLLNFATSVLRYMVEDSMRRDSIFPNANSRTTVSRFYEEQTRNGGLKKPQKKFS